MTHQRLAIPPAVQVREDMRGQMRGWLESGIDAVNQAVVVAAGGREVPVELRFRQMEMHGHDVVVLRMTDLSWWTRQELYPWNPDPEQRRLVYSYAITLQQYTTMQNSVFHPILLGMGESYIQTGDVGYLDKGVEQVENFKATDQGSYQDNMYLIDSRLDCQHFLRIYLDWANGGP